MDGLVLLGVRFDLDLGILAVYAGEVEGDGVVVHSLNLPTWRDGVRGVCAREGVLVLTSLGEARRDHQVDDLSLLATAGWSAEVASGEEDSAVIGLLPSAVAWRTEVLLVCSFGVVFLSYLLIRRHMFKGLINILRLLNQGLIMGCH